ncbi:MAG: hypothetical protein KIT18_15785 [Burkholderiales bacterium]|nr:hypothetical protein [Burkholderiales bacterium]
MEVLPVSTIWRFYEDGGCWRWQKRNPDRSVDIEAPAGFPLYRDCVADAQRSGFKTAPYDAHAILKAQRWR